MSNQNASKCWSLWSEGTAGVENAEGPSSCFTEHNKVWLLGET